MEHIISPAVTTFVRTGNLQGIEKWGLKLPLTLKASTLWSLYPTDTWAKNIYATKDFTNVIHVTSKLDLVDHFLRPVNWIVKVQVGISICS
jgi:hypothetical protein